MNPTPPPLEGKIPFMVRCTQCRHEWAAAYTPMPVADFVRVASNVSCPACAAPSGKITVATSDQRLNTTANLRPPGVDTRSLDDG